MFTFPPTWHCDAGWPAARQPSRTGHPIRGDGGGRPYVFSVGERSVANRPGTPGVYHRCSKVSLLGLTRVSPYGPMILMLLSFLGLLTPVLNGFAC